MNSKIDTKNLQKYANLLKKLSIEATTEAGSGHPTSSMSAAEILACLTSYLKIDFQNPKNPQNDRIIFSKGHAAPLLYSWYFTQNVISKNELLSLRKFNSKIEGHPSMKFEQIDAATGSLGQGLGVGLGLVLANKLLKSDAKTFVILGDSEIAEGSVWEAAAVANFHRVKNLYAFVDLNNLGQTRHSLYETNPQKVADIFQSFGWEALICENGNDIQNVQNILEKLFKINSEKPKAVIFQTKKGSGVSFLENMLGKHGKSLSEAEAKLAYEELGQTDDFEIPKVKSPEILEKKNCECQENMQKLEENKNPNLQEMINLPIRQVYGKSLENAGWVNKKLVVLDAETSNSTFSEIFKNSFPDRYFEMFIAEQNMVSVAIGFSRLGFFPVVNTFGAFFTRAFDQIRMAAYSDANILIVGSHVGVSIGEDGFSQMALEDISMMRAVENSQVFYPSDAVSSYFITQDLLQKGKGITYLRNTRMNLPQIYNLNAEEKLQNFNITDGFGIVKNGQKVAVIGAGVTIKEILKARENEKSPDFMVIDLFKIKPIKKEKLQKVLQNVEKILVVEDHHKEGGIFGAVCETLADENFKIYSLNVHKRPQSGKPEELLKDQKIDADAVLQKVQDL